VELGGECTWGGVGASMAVCVDEIGRRRGIGGMWSEQRRRACDGEGAETLKP
jgi:hypothetical protein